MNYLYQKQWGMYRENISFLWANKEWIFSNENYFFAPIPLTVYSVSKQIYLGALLKVWEKYEEVYSLSCQFCGKQMMIISFSGSPMTGTCAYSAVCFSCGEEKTGYNTRFNKLCRPLREYNLYYSREQKEGLGLDEVVRALRFNSNP